MRVLFIYPSDNKTFNSGLSYLSAILKKAGHQTALYWANRFDGAEFEAAVTSFRPAVAAVSSVTNQFPLAARLIAAAKSRGLKVILGGMHATLDPAGALATPGLDALCVGEGEQALPAFVERIAAGRPFADIDNLWLPDGPRNPVRLGVTDLDDLPDPDYGLFDYDHILDETGLLMVFANRGCPYRCNYCANHALLKLYGSRGFVRFLSPERLMSVLRRLVEDYPKARGLEFFDDTFILNRRWLEEFARIYPGAVGKPFTVNVRADLVDRDVVRLLRRAGCVRVNMAVETGSESLRREVLAKDVSDADLRRAFRLFRRAGIRTYAHNMVGVPGESEANILRGVELNRELKVDDLQCWTFYPYPGTEAREICARNGWIVDRGLSDTVAGKNVLSPLDQPGIDYERISFYFRTFKFRVLGEKTPAADVPLDFLAVGREEGQMISGWHALESDGGTPFRWTKPEARLYLRNSGKRGLAVLANSFVPGPSPMVSIEVDGRRLIETASPRGAWTWMEADLPKTRRMVLEVVIRVDPPFEASRITPADRRRLGLAVSQIRLEDGDERAARRTEGASTHR